MQYKGLVKSIVKEGSSEIVWSSLTEFENDRQTEGFAIKYVVTGVEKYIVSGRLLEVPDGHYLLLNSGRPFACKFRSEQSVQGFCITLDQDLIADVHSVLTRPLPEQLDSPHHVTPFSGVREIVYTRGNVLGVSILNLHWLVGKGRGVQSPVDLFYAIAVELVSEQAMIKARIERMNASKPSTKVELFARLETGRQLLEESMTSTLRIEDAARACSLSTFHFHRLFKEVYNISPHQFLVRKKVERAAALITEDQDSLGNIARKSGFSDIQAFSRSFCQQMGMSPTSWRIYHRKRKLYFKYGSGQS